MRKNWLHRELVEGYFRRKREHTGWSGGGKEVGMIGAQEKVERILQGECGRWHWLYTLKCPEQNKALQNYYDFQDGNSRALSQAQGASKRGSPCS